jgi:hypothetical protein
MRNATANADGTPQVLREHSERLQIALDKTFGLTHGLKVEVGPRGFKRVTQGAALPQDVPAFSGLAEAYVAYTGDTAFAYIGKVRGTQIYNIPNFESALGNTLTDLLIKDYATDYHWRDIVTDTTSPGNFKTQQRIRIRHVPDLGDVAEDEPYVEVSGQGDEHVTYAVIQKGGTLTITRRVVLADNVQVVKRLVEQLGRAAWRTLAKRVWNKVISNDTYDADGLAMFHSDHGNLGADALSSAALTAAADALFAQKEPGADERLGLSGPFLLAVPVELRATAVGVNKAQYLDATFNVNPWYGAFGAQGERIFVNPLFSDPDDWYLFDISGNVGIIEVGFLMGRQMPEIFVAKEPMADKVFAQDRIIYKIRHEYEAEIVDYRGSYKAVVI